VGDLPTELNQLMHKNVLQTKCRIRSMLQQTEALPQTNCNASAWSDREAPGTSLALNATPGDIGTFLGCNYFSQAPEQTPVLLTISINQNDDVTIS
jgi:hypothetical protein